MLTTDEAIVNMSLLRDAELHFPPGGHCETGTDIQFHRVHVVFLPSMNRA